MNVDLSALARNHARIRRLIGPRHRMLAVVKGNAYGHGAIEAARTLAREPDTRFGVAFLDEAVRLRQAGLRAPILTLYDSRWSEVEDALRYDVALSVCAADTPLHDWAKTAAARRRRLRLHLRLDTGHGPPGVPIADGIRVAASILRHPQLELEGVYTHLADPADPVTTREQSARFADMLERLRQLGIHPVVHVVSSGGVLRYPELYQDLVRPGVLLYARPATLHTAQTGLFENVMSWHTSIVECRAVPNGQPLGYGDMRSTTAPSRVAVIPVGYADGLYVTPPARRHVLVRGARAPIIARTMMDCTFVDVSSVPEARVGDQVVLLGSQAGAEITAHEVATVLGVPLPSVWCVIAERVERVWSADVPGSIRRASAPETVMLPEDESLLAPGASSPISLDSEPRVLRD